MKAISIKDPLSEKTRKERNLLILVSGLGLLCGLFNINPNKVAISGLEFTQTNIAMFHSFLLFLIAYFSTTFFVYSLDDREKMHLRDILEEQKDKDKKLENLSEYISNFLMEFKYRRNENELGETYYKYSQSLNEEYTKALEKSRKIHHVVRFLDFKAPLFFSLWASGVLIYRLLT